MGKDRSKIVFRILIKDGANYYYILKVIRNNSEVVCLPPNAGFHFTEHESGESHIHPERYSKKPIEEISIAITTGEAGQPCGSGFRHNTPNDLGAAYAITDAILPIESLESDYQRYNRRLEGCFIIDKALLPANTTLMHIGLWYVPSRNPASFEFNNKDIPENLLYKVTQCEPQIWAFARPFI